MATKKKAASKKTGSRKAKESPAARKKVGKVMHEYKHGELKSGGKRKVKNPKQAIAIALSEARRDGENVPPPKKKAAKKSTGRKAASSKSSSSRANTSGAKTGRAKTSGAKKSTAKKSSASKARKKSSGSRT